MKIEELEFVPHSVCCGQHEKATAKTALGTVEVYRNKREDGPGNYDIHVTHAGVEINRYLLLDLDAAQAILNELYGNT